MNFVSSAVAKLAASKLDKEQLYAQAAKEVASGQISQGLWAAAIAETGGGTACKVEEGLIEFASGRDGVRSWT